MVNISFFYFNFVFQRINVMITRAIGLLIIIGHKETLHKHSDWKKIIDYTIKNCE